MMGATLSNMGRNPLTGESAFAIRHVKDILSIMFTCGMYDYSGQWAYRVGVPAKSGVSGGVMAVVNRQLGIATYSPRLDPLGNSCRGIEVCVDLASRLGLHVFDCLNVGSSFLDVVLGEARRLIGRVVGVIGRWVSALTDLTHLTRLTRLTSKACPTPAPAGAGAPAPTWRGRAG